MGRDVMRGANEYDGGGPVGRHNRTRWTALGSHPKEPLLIFFIFFFGGGGHVHASNMKERGEARASDRRSTAHLSTPLTCTATLVSVPNTMMSPSLRSTASPAAAMAQPAADTRAVLCACNRLLSSK
jgi:hypothetical protein